MGIAKQLRGKKKKTTGSQNLLKVILPKGTRQTVKVVIFAQGTFSYKRCLGEKLSNMRRVVQNAAIIAAIETKSAERPIINFMGKDIWKS
ncbi:hypothetical protein SLA2020_105260 [Shorea laevis]